MNLQYATFFVRTCSWRLSFVRTYSRRLFVLELTVQLGEKFERNFSREKSELKGATLSEHTWNHSVISADAVVDACGTAARRICLLGLRLTRLDYCTPHGARFSRSYAHGHTDAVPGCLRDELISSPIVQPRCRQCRTGHWSVTLMIGTGVASA